MFVNMPHGFYGLVFLLIFFWKEIQLEECLEKYDMKSFWIDTPYVGEDSVTKTIQKQWKIKVYTPNIWGKKPKNEGTVAFPWFDVNLKL